MSGVGGLSGRVTRSLSPAAAQFLCCNEACPFPHVTALVDLTQQHKNQANRVVRGSEITIRLVGGR
jgi:hypothetical protein